MRKRKLKRMLKRAEDRIYDLESEIIEVGTELTAAGVYGQVMTYGERVTKLAKERDEALRVLAVDRAGLKARISELVEALSAVRKALRCAGPQVKAFADDVLKKAEPQLYRRK